MKKFDYTKLKGLREERGITQSEMSKLLNMTQSNYSKLESGFKKMDSLQTIENLSSALKMPQGRLIGILTDQENIESSGMQVSELLAVEEVIAEKLLREDEFIFFSAEVLDIDKYDFREYYSGLNLQQLDEDEPFPMWKFPLEVVLLTADSVEIGFDYEDDALTSVSVWLGDKKLGIISARYTALASELIDHLLISRVVLIACEDNIPGYFDTYMKAVFIATNAVCKSAEFKKGRFTALSFLSSEEVGEMDNEIGG